jgi:hypothetical protein
VSSSACLLGQPGRGIQRRHLAPVNEQDPIAEPFCFVHEVGDQDDRETANADMLNQRPGVTPGLRVESVVSSSSIAIWGCR